MTWPYTPLRIIVEIAPGADPTADPGTYTWVDISAYLRHSAKVVLSRGKRSAFGSTMPATCALTLDDRDGRFTLTNRTAPWYRRLRRNTPIRVRVDWGAGPVTRFVGYVDRWPRVRSTSGRDAYVPLTASGVLKRLTTGRAERSALYRYITGSQASGLLAYWSLEDDSGSQSAASAVEGAAPLSVGGSVSFGATAPLSGVARMVNPAGGYLAGDVPASSSTSWRVEFALTIDEPTTVNSRPLSWITNGGARAWNVVITPAGLHLDAYSTDTALVTTQIVDIDTDFIPTPGQLHHVRVDMNQVGIEIRMYVDGVQYGITDTLTDPVTPPTYLRLNADWAESVPRVAGLAIWESLPASDTPDAARGWIGQQAHERIEAVCADAGIPYSPVLGASVRSEPLGPQPAGGRVAVMRDAEETDGGILYELVTGELSYQRRDARYTQGVSLGLDYAAREVSPPFLSVIDDQAAANDITAKRPGGGEGRYVGDQSDGPYEAEITSNVRWDARLPSMAAWQVHLNTALDYRYEALSMNLAHPAQAGLVDAWVDTDIGSLVTVNNAPDEQDRVELILVGYTETLQAPRGWSVEMVCEPATPYSVGIRNSSVSGIRDTAGSALAAGAAAGATTLSVATLQGPRWTTGAVNFQLDCGGLVAHVTNISGTSPGGQTFTVDPIPYALDADTPVRVYRPAIRAA